MSHFIGNWKSVEQLQANRIIRYMTEPGSLQPEYDFIKDYLFYNSGNECPSSYHIWSALSILAMTVHNRFDLEWGYFTINTNLYIGLIGEQGKTRKTTGKDIAQDLFTTTFPDYPTSASVESREQIIKRLASAECEMEYRNPDGLVDCVRPMALFINEMKNFFSIDPSKMVDFLTDIYDRNRKHFKSSTIIRGEEDIKHPCINILACETPEWIQEKLKGNIITGGFARRIIYIYELDRERRISFPVKPVGATDAWERLQNHLKRVSELSAHFKWTEDAMKKWDIWYQGMKVPEDKVMAGYYESKHIQAMKIAMLLAIGRWPFVPLITSQLLEESWVLLDHAETNMGRLSESAGRNVLAIPMREALDMLEKADGWMPEKKFNRMMGKNFHPMEIIQVVNYLRNSTDQIVIQDVGFPGPEGKTVVRRMVMTKEKFESLPKPT